MSKVVFMPVVVVQPVEIPQLYPLDKIFVPVVRYVMSWCRLLLVLQYIVEYIIVSKGFFAQHKDSRRSAWCADTVTCLWFASLVHSYGLLLSRV